MKKSLAAFASFYLWSSILFAQVRKVAIKNDEILTVKAALGIATIIQLPETIQSAIIGDQSGFKIEYLDRAVTIKPLRSAVKTNLYLVTDKRRYNVRLVTLPQTSADYIVYVKGPEAAQPTNKWTKIGKSQQIDEVKLTIERIGVSTGGFILIDAKITMDSTKELFLKPEEFEIKQDENSKTINGLFLSSLKLSKNAPVAIGISLAKSDLVPRKPLTLEFRSRRTFSLIINEEFLWK